MAIKDSKDDGYRNMRVTHHAAERLKRAKRMLTKGPRSKPNLSETLEKALDKLSVPD